VSSKSGFPFNAAYEYRGSVNFPNDAVSSIQATNPKDHLGGNGNPVIYYRAKSFDEAPTDNNSNNSPQTTKFEAYTAGNYAQQHINFDSQFYYHASTMSNHYHFRAYSSPEQKDTFWVKPSTRGTITSGTTADMYVSGNVGIGTLSPSEALQVGGAVKVTGTTTTVLANSASLDYSANGGRLVSFGPNPSTPATFAIVLKGSDGQTGDTRLSIDSTGNVGIGTAASNAHVDVQGSVSVSGIIYAKFQDVAEWVPATAEMPGGTVVVVGEEADNTVTASTHAYDTRVAGVVSPSPGLLLGVAGESKAKIATTGRVRVRVDATKSPIRKGDLLVTSDRPGMAMKSEPLDVAGVKLHRPGTLIGKALEPLASGEGEILVLLSLQ